MKPIKTLALLACLALLTTARINAQHAVWQPIIAEFKNATLRGVAQIGDSTIVAVGEYGTIVRSTDLGNDWRKFTHQPIGGEVTLLTSVDVFADKTCIAVGNSGTVARSQDEGKTWQVEKLGSELLTKIRCKDNLGIIVGEKGVILQTTNNGKNWTRILSGTTNTLNDILIVSPNSIFVVGTNGTLLHSANEGRTWEPRTAFTSSTIASICGDNGKIILSADNAEIHRSVDAGSTWAKVNSNQLPLKSHALAMKGDTVIGVGNVDPTTEAQFFSFDAGLTWKQVATSYHNYDSYITLTAKKEFLICGALGHISMIRSSDVIADTSGAGNIGLGKFLFRWGELKSISEVRSKSGTTISMFLDGQILTTHDGGTSFDTLAFQQYVFPGQNVYLQSKHLFLNDKDEPMVRSEVRSGKKFLSSLAVYDRQNAQWKYPLVGDSTPYYRTLDVVGKYCCAISDTNAMMISTDGGTAWYEKKVPLQVSSLSLTASGGIWMMLYSNGYYILGKTRVDSESIQLYDSTNYARSIHARDDAVYTYGSVKTGNSYDETMKLSQDGGITWRSIFSQNTAYYTASKIVIGKSNGSEIVVQRLSSAELRYTTDNGLKWVTLPLIKQIPNADIDCLNDSTILVNLLSSVWKVSLQRQVSGVSPEPPLQKDAVEIYPNPAETMVKINLTDDVHREVTYRLFDNLGRLVSTRTGGREAIIPVSDLPTGTYSVLVYVGEIYHANVIFVKI